MQLIVWIEFGALVKRRAEVSADVSAEQFYVLQPIAGTFVDVGASRAVSTWVLSAASVTNSVVPEGKHATLWGELRGARALRPDLPLVGQDLWRHSLIFAGLITHYLRIMFA